MRRAVALAKVARPRLEGVCPRPRLFRRLDEATCHGAAWLEGPPGSGKTTLVASYLERRKARAVWYRVDEADGDVATFFHYLGVAAARVARGRHAWPRFRPDGALDVPAFARHFFRALYAALGDSFTLAIDDYHEAPPRSALHAVVRAALAELPERARAIVMSRSEPPPALARLRAHGLLARIDPQELELTADESRAIVRLRRGGRSARAAALHARSGGWAAGLTLLLAAGGDGTSGRGEAGEMRELFEYFAGEVLDRSDEATQRVLLETALLPQVTGEWAKRVTGVATADAILADLARRGYFTTRHGASLYAYHPLFREFLADRARQALSPGRLAEVRLLSARAVAESGGVTDAVALLRESGALGEAAQLVRERALQLLGEGRAETLHRLLGELPQASCESDPWLSYWLGMSLLGGDLSGARPALERAHGLFLECGDAAGAYLACAAVLDSYGFGEWTEFRALPRWIAAFDELRRRWPEFPSADVEACAACGIFTALTSARPDHPDLPAWRERVLAVATGGSDPSLRARAAFALAHFAAWRGDLAGAREALGPRPGRGPPGDAGFEIGWLVESARASATTGEGAEALEMVEEALALARAAGNHWWDAGSRLVGAWAASVAGDIPRAEGYLRALEKEFDPSLDTFFEQARGLILLRSGDHARASQHLLRSLALDEERGAIYAASWDHVALAAIARADGDRAGFGRHLDQAERLGELTRSRLVRYWTLLLRSATDDCATAVRSAAEALRLSRESGPFDELWVSRGDLAAACSLALEEGLEVEEARAIVARRRLEPPAGGASDAWPWPVAVRTLGTFALCRGGEPAQVSGRQQTRPIQLLEALVALGGAEVPEWKLTDALWPDAEADAAQHALEMNLSRLRRLLGARDAILQRDRKLTLEPRSCWVDALALDTWLAAVRPPGDAAGARRDAARALGLYRRPFLEGEESAWAQPTRERLRRRMRAFSGALALALQRAGCEEEARDLLGELARRDPELALPAAGAIRRGAPA